MCLNTGGGAGGGWFLEFALPGGNELTRGGVALEELGRGGWGGGVGGNCDLMKFLQVNGRTFGNSFLMSKMEH